MVTGQDIDLFEEGNPEKVLNLLKSKPHLHFEDENTPLHIAAYFGNIALANELILQYPEYLDALNRYGWSPLMQACREGHFECVELLLQNGADPSICIFLV